MINYSRRLDNALRKSAWAHEQAGQHRKGTDIPYIIHPVAVMMYASNVTNDEDTLVACLFHDVLEDVSSGIYSEAEMRKDFGDNVVEIVLGVTKDQSINDWHESSRAYLEHLENKASDKSIIVSIADKTHNLLSILSDHELVGEDLWRRFHSNKADQFWFYNSVLNIGIRRNAPKPLLDQLGEYVEKMKKVVQ